MNHKRTIALISAFALMISGYSCGKTGENDSEPVVANTTENTDGNLTWKGGSWQDNSWNKNSKQNNTVNNNGQPNNNNNNAQQQLEEPVIIPNTVNNNSGKTNGNGNSAQNGWSQPQYRFGNNNYIPIPFNSSTDNNNNNYSQNNSNGDNSGDRTEETGVPHETDETETTEPTTAIDSVIIEPGSVTYTAEIFFGDEITVKYADTDANGTNADDKTAETTTETTSETTTDAGKKDTAKDTGLTVTGTEVTVNGSTVIINAGGDYKISGTTQDGQIYVDTAIEEKVTLALNGVNITNTSGPALFVNEAKRCTIKTLSGTLNYLTDGGKDKIHDGAVFSNDTLRFKGNGELNITANNAHGISCDDDIIFDKGVYNIISEKTGLFANDDVTINDGNINIKGGTNGIKSKGTLNINGGTTIISGGSKEDKSSIYTEGNFNYIGGHLYAAGNRVSLPTYSEYSFILLDLGRIVDAETRVEMGLNGNKMVEFAPHKTFRCLLMLAPEIVGESTFRAVVDGNSTGDLKVSDGSNLFRMN